MAERVKRDKKLVPVITRALLTHIHRSWQTAVHSAPSVYNLSIVVLFLLIFVPVSQSCIVFCSRHLVCFWSLSMQVSMLIMVLAGVILVQGWKLWIQAHGSDEVSKFLHANSVRMYVCETVQMCVCHLKGSLFWHFTLTSH